MAAQHMNTHSTNTTKLKVQVAPLAILSLALPPTIATAHNRKEHVYGRHGTDRRRCGDRP
jgi:hypothetical protein